MADEEFDCGHLDSPRNRYVVDGEVEGCRFCAIAAGKPRRCSEGHLMEGDNLHVSPSLPSGRCRTCLRAVRRRGARARAARKKA